MAHVRDSDPLISQIKQWGHAHANRYAFTRADRCVHVLQGVRDMAPGTPERAMSELVGRDGRARRRLMAGGIPGMSMVPKWAVEPVRAANDASHPHDNPEIAVDMGIPEELRWVERALAAMARQYPLRALILRTEYTVAASQAVKAHMVQRQYEGALSLRQYRYELGKAVDWMRGMSIAA